MKYCVFCMLFNQFQKVLIFNLFWSTCYKIYSLQNTSVNTIPILQYIHFIKYHKKEPLSQTLVCCYIMALLFLETLIYCSIRKVSVSNKFFILLCLDWLKTFLNWFLLDWLYYWFYIWMWSHTWRVLWK